jgi:hypothetical protein
MLSMRLFIKEHTMKRQWQIRRQFQEAADAARRWDQAYQLLLQWSQPTRTNNDPNLSTTLQPSLEVTHDQRNLCPRIDRPADASPNH